MENEPVVLLNASSKDDPKAVREWRKAHMSNRKRLSYLSRRLGRIVKAEAVLWIALIIIALACVGSYLISSSQDLKSEIKPKAIEYFTADHCFDGTITRMTCWETGGYVYLKTEYLEVKCDSTQIKSEPLPDYLTGIPPARFRLQSTLFRAKLPVKKGKRASCVNGY